MKRENTSTDAFVALGMLAHELLSLSRLQGFVGIIALGYEGLCLTINVLLCNVLECSLHYVGL